MEEEVIVRFECHEFVLTVFSFVVSVAIVLLGNVFRRLSGRTDDLLAIQSSHTQLVPRVGGIAIFGSLVLTLIFLPATIYEAYGNLILATSLLFVVGLSEDLGFHMSPRRRLLIAVGASLLAIWLLGVWLPRTGIPGLDLLVNHWAIGIPLTLLVTAGMANGFNLIDGVNGLASVSAIVAAVARGDGRLRHDGPPRNDGCRRDIRVLPRELSLWSNLPR